MAAALDVRRAAAEAVGTFFLVLIGPGAATVNAYTGGLLGVVGIGLAFAFVVAAMIYAVGHLSGAHINPAVTLGFWSVRRFPANQLLPYIGAQCLGAVAAGLVLHSVFGSAGGLGATLPSVSTTSAFTIEWLLSFALMFVIMAVATDERAARGSAALAVGLTVGFCALTGGPITGASMNPARSLGPAVAADLWDGHWIYWVAPITAMIVAARTYDYLRPVSPIPPRSGTVIGLQGPIQTGVSTTYPEE
jgi:aquaporin Z